MDTDTSLGLDSTTSYRFSYRSCIRFTAHIRTIVEKFPALSTFDPQGLSVETFSCRLRDAMTALSRGQWGIKDFDTEKFLAIYPLVKVGIRDKFVIAGHKDSLKHAPLILDKELSVGALSNVEVKQPTNEILTALCILHHNRILTQPTKIFGDVSSEIVAKYDVVLQDEGTYKLLM
jgi:hypothetical protein